MNTALSTFTSSGAAAAADAFLDETDGGLQGLLLPTVKITDAGFEPADGNDPSDADKLPDGGKATKNGVPGIFLAKRTGILSWKVPYDKKGEEETPAFVAMVPDGNTDDVKLVGAGVKAYQMSTKDKKADFDFDKSGVGHIKPLLEFLVWLPDTGFTVISHTPNFYDVVDGIASTKNLVDAATGEISLTPTLFKPDHKPHKSGSYAWESSFCSTAKITDAGVKDTLETGFAKYRELIAENLDIKARVDSWLQCTDRPMTAEIREALNKAVKLNPPKF